MAIVVSRRHHPQLLYAHRLAKYSCARLRPQHRHLTITYRRTPAGTAGLFSTAHLCKSFVGALKRMRTAYFIRRHRAYAQRLASARRVASGDIIVLEIRRASGVAKASLRAAGVRKSNAAWLGSLVLGMPQTAANRGIKLRRNHLLRQSNKAGYASIAAAHRASNSRTTSSNK